MVFGEWACGGESMKRRMFIARDERSRAAKLFRTKPGMGNTDYYGDYFFSRDKTENSVKMGSSLGLKPGECKRCILIIED